MGFLRRMASILGFLHGAADDGDGGEDDGRAAGKGEAQSPTPAARKGFGVQVPVPAPRPQAGPVLVPCDPGEGGVQKIVMVHQIDMHGSVEELPHGQPASDNLSRHMGN
uniref:AT-hook DNA-binding motif-containing protein 1 n=1 Tax=Anthurium amnicola TaxID=1678845 RepID=A0A1D1Z7B6_9ARAE